MTKKTNILFILPSLGSGGSERVVMDIASGLSKNRFNPIVFSIKGGILEIEFKDRGIKTIISNKKEGRGHLKLMAQIYQIIKKSKIDIVLPHHITSLFYSFFAAKLNRKSKLYFTEHSAHEITSLNFFYKIFAIILLFFSHGCIAISREISENYKKTLLVNPKKIIYITNGVDVGRFNVTIDRKSKKRSLGITVGCSVIGTIANFRKQKNHKNLIFAFREVQRKCKNVVLVLAGSGPLEKGIKGLVNDLGISKKVFFLGSRSDVTEIYQIFDIFCLPSFHEGLPLCILEAMASKLPVVATNVCGSREIIISGKNGFLVPSNDARKLADVLFRLVANKNLGIKIAKEGYNTVNKKYSLEKWINKYECLFSI